MRIIGIETTCDETGVAIVEDGLRVLANVVASSVDLHKKYGGVVPEVAAREQVRVMVPVIEEAIVNAIKTRNSPFDKKLAQGEQFEIRNKFQNSKIQKWVRENIDAIAVAHGPGLIGSLLIGVETAKTLALVWGKPLVSVNHLIGHVYANWLSVDSSQFTENNSGPLTVSREPIFPLIALIVSGGHTDLILMIDHGKYEWLGGTLDDAAGEAFDKVARVLGLAYPGGPEIERVAQQLTIDNEQLTLHLPRPMIDSDDFDFSFSGLKTAVVNLVNQSNVKGQRSQVASEFQQAIVDVLVTKTIRAVKKYKAKSIVVGGGVAANESLRSQLTDHSSQLGIPVFFPSKELAIDNGAMIAAAAYYNFKPVPYFKLSADPGLYF